MVVAVLVTAALSTQRPSLDAWYTQIGFWHYQKDTVAGRSYIFHNAHIDGAKSGQATANVRFNKGFDGIREFIGRMALGPPPAWAGMLVQNKKTTYYFLVKKEKTGNFLQISRRNKEEVAGIFIATVSISDTVALRLLVKKDSLQIIAGRTTASMAKPSDFSGMQWIGFECLQGTVKVFEAAVASEKGEMKETFDHASLINLHLEKMFHTKK
jgi:hypothetical protein